jgi:uncharacterized membrane protein YhaH (DUF805 family)
MNAGSFLFGFSGRVNRAGYWIFLGIAALYGLELTGLVIPLIVAGIAVSARRLHDCDLSAWWLIVFFLLPGVLGGIGGIIMGQEGKYTPVSVGLELISTIISTWSFVQLACLRGTVGQNRFGHDPLTVMTEFVKSSR